MREDHDMDTETPDLRHLTEEEWLGFWRDALAALEQTQAAFADSAMDLTDVQAAILAGHAEMLRDVLRSRGVDLEG